MGVEIAFQILNSMISKAIVYLNFYRCFAVATISFFSLFSKGQESYIGHLGTEISVGLGKVDKYYPNGLIKYRTVIPSISFFYNYSYFRTGLKGSYQMSEFSSAFLLSSELGINLLGKKRDCKSFLGPTVKYGYYLDVPMYDFGKSNLTYRLLLIHKGLTFGVDFGRTFPNFQATYTTESVRHWYLDLGYTFCFRKKNLKE